MLKSLAAAAVLLVAGAAHAACESVQVDVLPFEPQHDYTVRFSDLSSRAHGKPTFGAVFATATAAVQGCAVKVGYQDTRLYIAAELRRNECAFGHVLAHEEEHVRIYREHLSTLAARIQARAGEADLVAVVEQELFAVRALHAAHDSPEEYRANATACSGRILRLAGLR